MSSLVSLIWVCGLNPQVTTDETAFKMPDLNIGTELLEQALPFLTNDNLDLGCVVIEHAATEKALPTIDEASCEKATKPTVVHVNSLNVVLPFYSSKLTKDPIGKPLQESLKRTRSGYAANSVGLHETGSFRKPLMESMEPENKTMRQFLSSEEDGDKWADLLPDSKGFEAALIAAVLGSAIEKGEKTDLE
ncbi:hypothetical protein VitviT2T_006505 [Vitis vinifera]|uniref:CCR4-NOT transcription complex subunit 1 domain-containing protein n=1 Tax=Vitis vinifera TaxID=29760 RepID=A0ABY9BW74_VITVI|nr:hypothetical protein VitviT2T_006505 [Vitis vinifera]